MTNLKADINELIGLDREWILNSEPGVGRKRDKLFIHIFDEIEKLEQSKKRMNYKDNLMPYLPVSISGYVFSDGLGELWCFSRDEDRVFHIGAEIEAMTNQKEWGKDFRNGFYAHNLKMAFNEVSENVGD